MIAGNAAAIDTRLAFAHGRGRAKSTRASSLKVRPLHSGQSLKPEKFLMYRSVSWFKQAGQIQTS